MYCLGAVEGGSKSELRGWNFQGMNVSLKRWFRVRVMAALMIEVLVRGERESVLWSLWVELYV